MKERKRKKAYSPELAGRMYKFFLTYDGVGAPSFSKFARSIGVSTEDLEGYRKKRNFDAAYRECQEIRRDYLIDGALQKRFDGSFTKFLITLEAENDAARDTGDLLLRLEVKE